MEDDSSDVIPFAVAGRQTALLVDFLSTRGLHSDAYLVAAGAGDRDGENGSDDDDDNCSKRLHEMHVAPPKSNKGTKDKTIRYVCRVRVKVLTFGTWMRREREEEQREE